jgi:hypothetical protein
MDQSLRQTWRDRGPLEYKCYPWVRHDISYGVPTTGVSRQAKQRG